MAAVKAHVVQFQMQQPSPMGAGGPRSVPGMMAAAQSPLGTPMAGGASADPDAAYRDKIRELQVWPINPVFCIAH